jgi:lipoprotein-releasing system permease protein
MAGFESFVAWRYLMARERRVSRLALIIFLIGLGLGGGGLLAQKIALSSSNPFGLSLQGMARWGQILSIGSLISFALAGLAVFFGALRLFFTFFTVVPLGGVWIGTLALVCVLSVMSGFESDLRRKILGSNAHVQITREDGDFAEWREVKAAIDKISGVRGSTPFATSEVVIAANNNGMSVIIKGIDPDTIGSVTDLVKNIKVSERSGLTREEIMQRLRPLVNDELDSPVPVGEGGAPDDPTAYPAPDDLLEGGGPIDFSQPGAPKVAPEPPPPPIRLVPRSTPTAPPAKDASADVEPPISSVDDEDFGGDAVTLVGKEAGDDEAPDSKADATGGDAKKPIPRVTRDGDAHVITVPMDSGRGSRRTQSLPGVLVGSELVKQTNIWVDQEVRVVSPLSDPANPDATGTPIPFNRDFRVAGVFYTGMYEYDLKQVYVTLDAFQSFLDRGDTVDGIEVRLAQPDDAAAYVKRISAVVGPSYRVVDWTELNRSLFSALKLEKITMFIVLGIVILVASFSIVGNLIMVVFEKGREIALLKTLGATNWGVMWLFMLRGLMIGTIGTVLGVGMGLSACMVAKYLGFPLNPDVYYIDKLPIHIDGSSVAIIALAGVVISGLAALYPALLAIRIRPATGLRH